MFLPLVYQEGNGTVANTTVLEQPLDFTTLAEKYDAFISDFVQDNADKPFFLYAAFSQ
jgi:hypothetical protein